MIINGNIEYKEHEFVHFVKEYTGEVDVIETKKGERRRKKFNMREIPFTDIISVNLNTKGKSIPFSSNGVINVNRYMFWFWTPLIGSDAISLYTLLNEYCDDETDFCYPKEGELAERLGVSIPTVDKKADLLEEHNFIYVISRLNKLNSNRSTSNLYKVRKTIPLLSRELYLKLPDYLRKKHDDFMKRYANGEMMDYFSHDSNKTATSLLVRSERIITKKEREKINAIIENAQQAEYILVNLSASQQMYSEKIRELLKENWSKPSYESFFSDAIAVYDKETNQVDFIVNELAKEVINSNQSYKGRLSTIFYQVYDSLVKDMSVYTFKEYIIKIERLK